MRVVKQNWYGFDHAAVDKQFGGKLSFCNEFCVNGEVNPSAVYKAAAPDRSKGHKDYFLLTKDENKFIVRGMTPEEMEKFRYQAAVHCLSCDDVIYSVNRHDFRSCSCGKVSIDGGRDYTKIAFQTGADYMPVTIDLLDNIVSDPR